MRKFLAVALAAVLLLTLSGTAFAAKGGHGGGGGTTPSGTCSVSPNPAALGGSFAVTGAGLPANTFVNVDVSEAAGTQTYFAMTDASGSFSASGWASVAGTNSVSVTTSSGRKTAVLATCSFYVQ